MTRNKRRIILALFSVLIIIILACVFIILYKTTDSFKSEKTLFTKYFGKSIENVQNFYEDIKNSQYNQMIRNNPYESETKIKINYIENKQTSIESTQNAVNSLKIEIEGQVDNSNQYQYQMVHLLNKDEKIETIEMIQKGNEYGIRFSDLFQQYLLVENGNLKEIFQKLGYSEEELSNFPDNLENIATFSEQEKESLIEKYLNVFYNYIDDDDFSKEMNQTIRNQ